MKQIKKHKLVAKLLNPLFPQYSKCRRCNRNWKICKGHTTPYDATSGCFPLCEDCWLELGVEERVPYYIDLWLKWRYDGQMETAYQNTVITKKKLAKHYKETDSKLILIVKAVMEGK